MSEGAGRGAERIGLVAGAVVLLASMLFLGLSGMHGLGIAVALIAIIVAKTLYLRSSEATERKDRASEDTGRPD